MWKAKWFGSPLLYPSTAYAHVLLVQRSVGDKCNGSVSRALIEGAQESWVWILSIYIKVRCSSHWSLYTCVCSPMEFKLILYLSLYHRLRYLMQIQYPKCSVTANLVLCMEQLPELMSSPTLGMQLSGEPSSNAQGLELHCPWKGERAMAVGVELGW